MDFATHAASNYPVSDLVNILNQGFEDYLLPIKFTNPMFLNMLRKDSIDLNLSRVLLVEDQPSGIALIAPRAGKRTSRLAAMGISKPTRGKKAGSWLMKEVIDEACKRDDREMVLEVIEQNEPAVKLYQKCGFESVRRLVGFIFRDNNTGEKRGGDLQEISLQEMSTWISQYGVSDLPWQLSGDTIAQMSPPVHAYRSEQAYVVFSNPEVEHVVIWSLLVEPEARGRGQASKILKRAVSNHPGMTWHVPALCPEEFGNAFERAGFEREKLSQRQMRLSL
jgi:ribosomal protein S18 acetylase RimI-like enzyme